MTNRPIRINMANARFFGGRGGGGGGGEGEFIKLPPRNFDM